ncbi:MAG: acyltransferase [Planctomycetales bacterium]|nr:acyltransferase [Planctomycetales bacterium]
MPSESLSTVRQGRPVWQLGEHIPQLDGVRGLAILIVTLYRFSKELPNDTWAAQALRTGFSMGDRGVDLFFVLSGFLITGILLDSKGNRHTLAHFLARRSLRIFPLYFVALFLFLVAVPSYAPYREMFAQAASHQFFLWTYLTNIKMSLAGEWCFGYLDHFWSLAVEEHFYLVWPLILLCCSRRTALTLACLLALGSAVSRVAFAKLSENGVAPDVLTPFRCDALLIGSILALQIRGPQGLHSLKKWTYAVFPIALTVGVGCALFKLRAYTVSHTLWPLIWASVLIWLLTAGQQRQLARFFNLSPLRKLGKYSYAMYVFQSPLIPLTAGVVSVPQLAAWSGSQLWAPVLYLLLLSALTYAAALLSWYLLERHCLKLKRWFPTDGHYPAPAQPTHCGGRALTPPPP